jgi:hypothetical protein
VAHVLDLTIDADSIHLVKYHSITLADVKSYWLIRHLCAMSGPQSGCRQADAVGFLFDVAADITSSRLGAGGALRDLKHV